MGGTAAAEVTVAEVTVAPGAEVERGIQQGARAGAAGLTRDSLGLALRSPYLWLVAAPLFWSGNIAFGRVLAEALPPLTLSVVRWSVAAAILAAVARYGGGVPWPKGKAWGPVAAMAGTGVATFTPLVYLALGRVGATEASLIQSSTPVFALLLAWVFLGETLGWRKIGGALLTIAGVAVIVSHGGVTRLFGWRWDQGDLEMLLAAFIWGAYTVATRQAARYLPPLAATLHASWLGLLMLLPALIWELSQGVRLHLTPLAWIGVAYISLFPSAAAFLAWSYGIGRVGAGRGAIFNNLLAVFTALWAVWLLGEALTPAKVAGGLLILAGVTFGSLSPRGNPGAP